MFDHTYGNDTGHYLYIDSSRNVNENGNAKLITYPQLARTGEDKTVSEKYLSTQEFFKLVSGSYSKLIFSNLFCLLGLC